MDIKGFNGAVIDSVKSDGFDATITFTDGRRLFFRAEGYQGTKLIVFTTKKVKKMVEETVEIEIH